MSQSFPAHFPIVCIGASAGGLKAIEKLLLNLPDDTGMAYIIVQHLSRRFKSLMQEILAKDTHMPVVLAEHRMQVRPNHVYLIPAGYELRIDTLRLSLTPRRDDDGPHFVIDIFLHALGHDVGADAVAIILSGTGSDGSRGIRTIKENGGIVMVQDPKSGEFDGMPLSAIDTHHVDFILNPEAIAEKLTVLSEIGSRRLLEDRAADQLISSQEATQEAHLNGIFDLLKKYRDVDFSFYKENTIQRRIEKHMSSHNITTLHRYYNFLIDHPDEVGNLFQELLIGVTEFFRDPKAYEALVAEVFPRLLATLKQQELRIWICACSTGEEVYSIAIALHQYASQRGLPLRYTLIATDVNNQFLATASKGRYAPSKLEGLAQETLDTYFEYDGERFEVKSFIRDNIIFARNDATLDPPFINLDLVCCRNFLIYLKNPLQRKLLLNFHFGLKPNGFLWLGISENVLDFKESYRTINEKYKLFQAWGETPRIRQFFGFKAPEISARKHQRVNTLTPTGGFDKLQTLRQSRVSYSKLLLDRFVPTSILINEEFQVLYITGGAGKYLHLPDMEVSKDLLNMVSDEMVIVLRDALRRLLTAPGPLSYPDVTLRRGELKEQLTILIEQIDANQERPLFLVTFQQSQQASPPPPTVVEGNHIQTDSYEIIRDLQAELSLARQEVQNSLEELETSNEELQSTNEELLASNEELQSTNEELQSVNEELYTVNSEMMTRNKELVDANSTIDNLLTSSDIGTLFLDHQLQIRLFTPSFRAILRLSEQDLGTSIDKFNLHWEYPDFQADLETVLETKQPLEKEIGGLHPRQYYLVKIRPLLVGEKLDGLMILLIDISRQKQTELDLIQAQQRQRTVLDDLPIKMTIIDPTGNIQYVNWLAEGAKLVDLVGTSVFAYMDESNAQIARAAFDRCIDTGDNQIYTVSARDAQGGNSRFYNQVKPLRDPQGQIDRLLVTTVDLSETSLLNNKSFQRLTLFERIFDHPHTLITIKDDQFRYLYANQGLAAFIGLPLKSILGSNDFALFPHEIATLLRNNDERVLAEQTDLAVIETFTRQQQTLKTASHKFSITLDQQVHLIQIAIPLDLTAQGLAQAGVQGQVKLEELVDQRTEALIRANQDLRAFTRTMAHDLRGPLRAVHTFGEMLKIEFEERMVAEEHQILDKILRQSSRMAQIIDGLLSYVKMEGIAVNKQWVDMKRLAQEVWEDLQYLRNTDDFNLTLRETPDLWADFQLIKQILTNLFSNALKYRHPDRLSTVEFGAYWDERVQQHVYFVKDNGVGFDQADAKKMFDVFERLHEARHIEGHGIGLSIVQKAIEIQGGTIWVQGQLGEGATFYFSLPNQSGA